MRRIPTVGTLVAATLLVAPGAQAATTVGEVAANPDSATSCGASSLGRQALQLPDVGHGGTITTAGVVTEWRSAGRSAAPTPGVALLVLRWSGEGNFYSLVDGSPQETLPEGSVGAFATRITVAEGDTIGLDARGVGVPCYGSAASGRVGIGPYSQEFLPKPPFNVQYAFGGVTVSPARVNLSVRIEPDADGDGYGDETQDLCPSDPTTAGACPGAPVGGDPPGGAPPQPSTPVVPITAPAPGAPAPGGSAPSTTTPSTARISAPALKGRKGGSASGRFTAPTAGRLTWTGRVGKATVARGSLTVKKGPRTITVRLSAAGKRALTAKRRLSVKLTFTFTPQGGKPVRASRTVRFVA